MTAALIGLGLFAAGWFVGYTTPSGTPFGAGTTTRPSTPDTDGSTNK